jgi:VWFA-related protein
MRKRSHTRLPTSAVLVALAALFCAAAAAGQDAPEERRKLKDFGSSLDRLKWDAKKNAAVEKRRKGKDEGVEGAEGAEGGDDVDIVRVETSLVVCDLLVLDPQGHPVEGLTREDFEVAEDGRPQEVGTFAHGEGSKLPRSIVLVIDYSGSQFPFLKTSVEAAKTLVDGLGPADRMAVVTDDVEVIQDFTGDKEKLKKRLDSLVKKSASGGGLLGALNMTRRFGRSAQYSALMATLREAFGEEDRRPIVVFQTDGDELPLLRNPVVTPAVPPELLPPDMREAATRAARRLQVYLRQNVRAFSLEDIYRAAERSRATVYAIIPGYRLLGLPPERQTEQARAHAEASLAAWVKPEDQAKVRERFEERARRLPPEVKKYQLELSVKAQAALAGVAEVTGGWVDFLEQPSQASEIYSRILSDINRRYVLGYYPTNKEHDGTRRLVRVEVRGHHEYTILGRKSYIAPGPE